MNDLELIKNYLSGDKKSFDIIYEKYVNKIYRFIYLKTTNKEVSEDIVSEVFLSVLDNIDSFKLDSDSNFNSWIYKIAYNKIIDFYKKDEKQKTFEIWDYLDIWFEEDLNKKMENKDKLKEIFKFLKTIKPEYRDILIYKIWEDLSFKEISEITWMSLDNCKKISSRILKTINEKFIILLFIFLI